MTLSLWQYQRPNHRDSDSITLTVGCHGSDNDLIIYTEYKTESHWQCHFLDDINILGHSPMDNGTSLTVTLSYWHCHDDSKNDQVIETVIKSHGPLWLQQRSQLMISKSFKSTTTSTYKQWQWQLTVGLCLGVDLQPPNHDGGNDEDDQENGDTDSNDHQSLDLLVIIILKKNQCACHTCTLIKYQVECNSTNLTFWHTVKHGYSEYADNDLLPMTHSPTYKNIL